MSRLLEWPINALWGIPAYCILCFGFAFFLGLLVEAGSGDSGGSID